MNHIKSNHLFLGSIFIGVVFWLFVYSLLPVDPQEDLKTGTLAFIIFNYLALIIGFYLIKFKKVRPVSFNYGRINKLLVILLITITACYILRWFDLFVLRELSFKSDPKTNKLFSEINYQKSNIVLMIASVLKSAYFFPFVIAIGIKSKINKTLFIFCCIAMLYPFLEAILKGTRKPFLEVFLIVFVSLIMYQRIRLDIKTVVITVVSIVILFVVTTAILYSRETKNNGLDYFYSELLNSRYNDLLSPQKEVKDYFNEGDKSDYNKFLLITGMHFGQYLTHGVFEFNHIYDENNTPTNYGGHTFFVVPKLINELGLFNEIQCSNPPPREKVYLTLFGGLYLDFRWFGFVFMFLFGIFQKYIFYISKHFIFSRPIIIYFLIINVFLLIINYLRGGGIYPIVCFFLLVSILKISRFNLYEKGISA